MTKLTDQDVETIARRIVADLEPRTKATPGSSGTPTGPGLGIFATVEDAVRAASVAQPVFVALPLELRAKIIAAIQPTLLMSCSCQK